MLLLIFAAITLGGLGTAFGALLGSLIVGTRGRGLDPLDPVRSQVRGRARRAHPHPARQTSGLARSQREIGVAAMDWGADSLEHAQLSAEPGHDRVRARGHRPRRALRLRRPAQLRYGRLHGPRRLRVRDLGAVLRMALVARHARSVCIAAAIFALILGIPTLRLRADYLAIVTIAAAEIVRLLFTTQVFDEWTNSADGLGGYHAGFRAANPFPPGQYGWGPWTFNETGLWVRVFGLAMLALAILLVWSLMRSPWGRVLKGIREDEDAVRSLGKNVFAYKMQALVVGGVIGAMGGIVYVLPSAVGPVELHDVADVLPVDDPPARRRGHRVRPDAGCGHLLGRHRLPRQSASRTRGCRHPAACPRSRRARCATSWSASRSCSS